MVDKTNSDMSPYEHFLGEEVCEEPVSFCSSQTGYTPERLHSIAAAACQRYTATQSMEWVISFYPYNALKSTIRVDNGVIRIRISDILCKAPEEVLDALIHILVARFVRRKPLVEWQERFGQYIQRPDIEAIHARTRQVRNRKVLSPPQGIHHDLGASFERVNAQYFQGALSRPTLSWSPRRSRRRLGYHDAALNLIMVSRYLDRRIVPVFVVEYVLYHELLHTVIRPTMRKGKRVVHSSEFRRKERLFEHYDEATRWLKGTQS